MLLQCDSRISPSLLASTLEALIRAQRTGRVTMEDEDGHSVSMTGACQNLECMADRFALKSFSISNLSYFVFCL